MLVTCDQCKEGHSRFRYRPTSHGFEAICSLCDGVAHVPWTQELSNEAGRGSTAEGHRCPKCSILNAESADHCTACGLKRALWSTWKQEHVEGDAILQEKWIELEKNWQNKALHQELANHCRKTSELPWLASKYRKKSIVSPGDPFCQAHLEKITKQAQLFMLKNKSAPHSNEALGTSKTPRKWGIYISFLFFLILLVLGALFSKGLISNEKNPKNVHSFSSLP